MATTFEQRLVAVHYCPKTPQGLRGGRVYERTVRPENGHILWSVDDFYPAETGEKHCYGCDEVLPDTMPAPAPAPEAPRE